MMSFYLKALFFAIVVLSMVLTIPSVLADNWYVGKGLKQGDYFRYNVCHVDYHNCAPLEIDFWVQNQTSDGNWNLQFLAIDAKEIQRGTVTIGGILFYPLNYSSNLSNYVNVYNNTIGWINQFSNKAQPKSFGDLEWGSSGFTCGQSVGPIGQANVTVQAGTFNAWTIRWTVGADSMIWVAPNLPFPVKGLVYYSCHLGSPYPVHVSDYELLQTGNSQTLPPQLDFTSVWSHPQSIMPPRQQIVNGVSPDKVVCSQGFVLIMKTSVNSAACVKPQTAQKLVERGWGTIIAGSITAKNYSSTPVIPEVISHFEPSTAQARSSILITPDVSVIDATRGETVNVTLTVVHAAGKNPLPNVTLTTKGVHCCFTPRDSTDALDLNQQVTFSEKKISLKPGEMGQIVVQISIPKDWPSQTIGSTIFFPLEFGNEENYLYPDLFIPPMGFSVHILK